jgi:hypothetical protein
MARPSLSKGVQKNMKNRIVTIFLLASAAAMAQTRVAREGVSSTAGVGGVTANLLASKDTSNPTQYVLPSAGGCGSGVAMTTATAGNPFNLLDVSGINITMVADGTITAGHIVTGGSSTPGRVADTGQTSVSAVPQTTCIVGTALANATVGNTVTVRYHGPGQWGTRQEHMITFVVDGGGSTVPTGDIGRYPTANFACTIYRIDIAAGAGETTASATVDVWKNNANVPNAANKISASAPLTLSSAQINQNGSLTGWSTTVAAGDVFGFNVASATNVTKLTGQIWCH